MVGPPSLPDTSLCKPDLSGVRSMPLPIVVVVGCFTSNLSIRDNTDWRRSVSSSLDCRDLISSSSMCFRYSGSSRLANEDAIFSVPTWLGGRPGGQGADQEARGPIGGQGAGQGAWELARETGSRPGGQGAGQGARVPARGPGSRPGGQEAGQGDWGLPSRPPVPHGG